MLKRDNQFTIEASSDSDYEKMVIYLNFNNNEVAVLNCDKGIEKVEIKIFDRFEEKVTWDFDFQSFMKALTLAGEKLKEINRSQN